MINTPIIEIIGGKNGDKMDSLTKMLEKRHEYFYCLRRDKKPYPYGCQWLFGYEAFDKLMSDVTISKSNLNTLEKTIMGESYKKGEFIKDEMVYLVDSDLNTLFGVNLIS